MLLAEDGDSWNYFRSWTLGRLEGTGFRTLDYSGCMPENNSLYLALEKGIYRLITVRRRPDGSQCVLRRTFALEAGETKRIKLKCPEEKNGDRNEKIPLQDFALRDANGNAHMLSALTKEEAAVLAFLGTGEEPTEHVLNELLDCASRWNERGHRLLAVLRSPEELENRTLRKVLDNVSGIQVYAAGGKIWKERRKAWVWTVRSFRCWSLWGMDRPEFMPVPAITWEVWNSCSG